MKSEYAIFSVMHIVPNTEAEMEGSSRLIGNSSRGAIESVCLAAE